MGGPGQAIAQAFRDAGRRLPGTHGRDPDAAAVTGARVAINGGRHLH